MTRIEKFLRQQVGRFLKAVSLATISRPRRSTSDLQWVPSCFTFAHLCKRSLQEHRRCIGLLHTPHAAIDVVDGDMLPALNWAQENGDTGKIRLLAGEVVILPVAYRE